MATKSFSQQLAALGLPGFGEAKARRAFALMERYGVSPHAAVFGGRELQLAIFEAQEAGR